MMLRIAILGAVAAGFPGYANGGTPRDGTGITPWEMSPYSREINEGIRQDRVGPIACPRWQAMPLWKRLVVREHSWCGDWLATQERLAALPRLNGAVMQTVRNPSAP